MYIHLNIYQKNNFVTEWENLFAYDIFDKGLISKMHKEHIQLNIKKKQTTQIKMG